MMQSNGMNTTQKARTLEGRMRHFETLLEQINASIDPSTQAKVEEVIRVLMELHGAGLERMLDLVWESGLAGQELINGAFAQDELASSLLLLHGLHPLSLETRVNLALEKVRPYMHSHGGDVEILGVRDDGVVQLRLDGTCHGCPSSRVTLKFAVEKAIYESAPDAAGIEVIGESNQGSGPAGIEVIGESNQGSGPAGLPTNGKVNIPLGEGWVEVPDLKSMKTGSVRVQKVVDTPILFCRVENNFYAYGSLCPKCGQLLGQAKLSGRELACPQCAHHFDVLRAGRDLDEPALHLAPYPLLQENGMVKVAV